MLTKKLWTFFGVFLLLASCDADQKKGQSQNPDNFSIASDAGEVATELNQEVSATAAPADRCTTVEHQFPNTDFDSTTGRLKVGANDAAPVPADYAPELDNYWGSNFDTTKYSDQQWKELAEQICNETGVPVKFLNVQPGRGVEFESDSGMVQVITGIMFGDSRVTIILPPHWSDKFSNKYPIFLNTSHSNNKNLMEEWGPRMLRMIATNAGSKSGDGVIGVLFNGGGEMGRAYNPKFYEQAFGAIFQAQVYGGDKNRVVTFGSNKGGVAALATASNIKDYDYKVILSYASAVPGALGSTFNWLKAKVFYGIRETAAIDLNDSMKCTRYPLDLDYNRAMIGANYPTDPNEVSVTHSSYIRALKDQGTQIVLEMTGHDPYVPYVYQRLIYTKLIDEEVPVEGRTLMFAGNNPDLDTMERRLNEVAKDLAVGIEKTWVRPGLKNYYVAQTGPQAGKLVEHPSLTNFPITFEVPIAEGRTDNLHIVMTGPADAEFEVKTIHKGVVIHTKTGKLNSRGYTSYDFNPFFNKRDIEAGDEFTYDVTIDSKRLLMSKTPGGHRAQLSTKVKGSDYNDLDCFQWVDKLISDIPRINSKETGKPITTTWGVAYPNLPNNAGSTGIALFNDSNATFYAKNQLAPGSADKTLRFGPAGAGWKPLAGDWTGNGQTTVALFDSENSRFYIRNSFAPGSADITFGFGPKDAGWLPIAGDWNGDGKDTIGLYNPSNSTFYLKNALAAGNADVTVRFGPAEAGWLPIAGDWNGDGKDTIGLYNPENSYFYLKNNLSAGSADASFGFGARGAGWLPIAGDWNSDGKDTIGLYSPDSSTFYLRNALSGGNADTTLRFGPSAAGWIPLAGSW